MRFAANLGFLFPEHSFLDRFRAAREAGFTAVEFAAPYDHAPGEIAARLRDNGLACVLFNLPMGEARKPQTAPACHPGRTREFREGVELALEYAAALGNRRINCIAGVLGEADDPARCGATLVDNLRHAAEKLAGQGITLLLEPINTHDVPGFFVATSAQAAQVIAQANVANLGLQCDLYHTAMMGDDPSSILAAHRGILRHVQFADAPGRGEPGTGRVDFERHFETLRQLGYDGWVSAEYRPTKPTRETLHWMQRFA